MVGRISIQSVKLAWSLCIQRLKLAHYPLSRGIIKDVKQIHTLHWHTHTHTHKHTHKHTHNNIEESLTGVLYSSYRVVVVDGCYVVLWSGCCYIGWLLCWVEVSVRHNWTHLLFNLSDLMAVLYYVGCVEFNKIKILFSYLDVFWALR